MATQKEIQNIEALLVEAHEAGNVADAREWASLLAKLEAEPAGALRPIKRGSTKPPAAVQPAPDNSLAQWAGVATDALLPYAAGAGVGAGLGTLFPIPGVGTGGGGILGAPLTV